MTGDWLSRFVRASDARTDTLLAPLPRTWWSRPYEYAWAARFAESGATVLDAGCGIAHPFKFWLGATCAKTVALDIDPRIGDRAAVRDQLQDDLGVDDPDGFLAAHLPAVELICGSMLALPFADAAFDRVFCLSVLEHLARADQTRAMTEFHRVLKPDGLLVITVDCPAVTPAALQFLAESARLVFAGPVDFAQPTDAITMPGTTLRCFRALFRPRPGPAAGHSPT